MGAFCLSFCGYVINFVPKLGKNVYIPANKMEHTDYTQPSGLDFSDIRPYDDHEFRDKIAALVKEPGFEHAVRYVMPDVDYPEFVKNLLTVETQMDFQVKVMGPFLEMLVAHTTKGLSADGL